MMQAILYSRWSSLEQKGTTSASRQLEITEGLAQRNGWTVVERLVDSGKSAWTGDNLSTGELGRFAEKCQRGGGKDKVLIVEKLDRLSRQKPRVMARWIETMVLTGLTIMTADGRHVIDEAALDNPMIYMTMIFEAFRGYEESETKSIRVASAWSQKRLRGAPMTARCPAWLKPSGTTHFKGDQSTSSYQPIENRAKLVLWMFKEVARVGPNTIAKMLNERGEPVWGRGNGWHGSYVKKILSNPAVIGEYQPCTKPKGGERIPAGEPIRDYFPPIVSLALFQAVNDKRQVRLRQEQSGHNRLVNLFAGLAVCAGCGGTMTFLDKGTETLMGGTLAPRRYLKCSRVHRSVGGCGNKRSFNYMVAETAVLDELLHRAMDDQHFAQADSLGELESEIVRLSRDLDDAKRRQEASMQMLEDDADDELAQQRYRQHRAAMKATRAALEVAGERLADARGKVSPAEHIKRVGEVRAMLDHADPDQRYQARLRVKLALNDLIEWVSFNDRKRRFVVKLTGGIRHISFDLQGGKGDDLEWTDVVMRKVGNSVVAGYVRRRAS